jgi:SAM-dependent methyltransferase
LQEAGPTMKARIASGLAVALALAWMAEPSCRPAAQHDPSGAEASAPLGEAAAKILVHGFFDAHDAADEPGLAAMLATAFTYVDDGRPINRDDVISEVRARHERHPSRSRDYKSEDVWMGPTSFVYFGETIEHFAPDGLRYFGDVDGYSTLVWTKEGNAWKATSWQWIMGGLDGERAEWNSTYRSSLAGKVPTATGRAYRAEPNAFLAEIVKGHNPGTALDVAMGQGRNALFLAEQGWQVTGFDISDEGVAEARDAAEKRHLQLEAVNADVAAWDFGTRKWDLITFIYAAGCPNAREHGCDETTVDKVRRALKPGGLVVVAGYNKDEAPGIGFDTGELAALFKNGFTMLRDEVVEEPSDWGNQRGVPEKIVRFAARKD